jgi:hypothetical protein
LIFGYILILRTQLKNYVQIYAAICLILILWTQAVLSQVTVTVPNASAGPNASLMIPVNVSSLTGLGVTAYEFIATCDTAFVQFDGVDVAGTISSGQGVFSNDSLGGFSWGRMKVVCATALPLSGSGILVNLKATTKNKGGSSPIQVTALVFNNGIPSFALTNGTLTVNAGLLRPTITPVSSKTVAEGDSLLFTVIATDPNGLTMTFSGRNFPAGATIGSSTGQFAWKPTYAQAGSYSPLIKVTDTGGAADSITISITVTNVNRKPVFNAISAKTARDYDTLSVTLVATDPDNDPLTYSLLSVSPTASTTPAVTGSTLKWVPAFADTGKTYSVTVRVSDNIVTGGGVVPGTDTTMFNVTVNRSRGRGDVDGNGKIQAADAALILKHAANLVLLTNPAAQWAANIDGLGISAASASEILKAAAGLRTI